MMNKAAAADTVLLVTHLRGLPRTTSQISELLLLN